MEDQRICIKFCVKNRFKGAEIFWMLQTVYGDALMSRRRVFEWYKRFKEGREETADNERSGRPSTLTTPEKVDKVLELVREDRRITVREVAEEAGISFRSTQSIMKDILGVRRLNAVLVPKDLTFDQKNARKETASLNLEATTNDPELLKRASEWRFKNEPRPKKARKAPSKVKVMLTVFFDYQGVVHHEFQQQGSTITADSYLGVLRRLREAIRQKRTELWRSKSWILHHDNAPAYTALKISMFLQDHSTSVFPQPPYSPDLAPYDFFLFGKLKKVIESEISEHRRDQSGIEEGHEGDPENRLPEVFCRLEKKVFGSEGRENANQCENSTKVNLYLDQVRYTHLQKMENSVQVPKFDGENFASWKFRIVSILEGKELDDLMEGDPPEDEVKFKEWKKKDAQAKGIITCAMTDSLVALILNCKTSKDIWIALHERYEGDKKKKIIEARNDVSRLTMKKEENWEEYLYRSEKLLEQARNLGAEIEDQEFTTSVIRGLPQKYNLVALQLNCQMKNMDTCQVCIQAKHPRTPFKPVLYPQSTRPLDLIHIDLIGPIQEESIGGAKYVLTLVDDFSRKIFVEFLSSKLETFDIIRSFIEEIEKRKEIKVKQLRSDNGKEFTNNQMTQYLKGKGIKHQLTNVYTPQQNGISERYNRTLIEGTRALLIDSQLPLRYWAETMSTFAYLKNRTPCKKLGWITPEERFSNRKPTVAHLKIFGCIAYYYVHKHKRGKFQPTAKAGIFVGYSSTRKAWRLIDPENENVIETRDVKFLENKLGKEILNKNVSDDTQKYFLYNFPEETIPETSEEVENHDDHSHSDFENQDEHSELPYNLRPNLKDKLYYELSSDDEPIEDNEGKDPTYDPTVGALKLSHGNLLPSSYEEAINHPDSPLWQQAMNKEIHSLQNHHVWDLTELPEGAKAIKSKWIFSKKMDPQTNQEIYKARLVALGCSQEYGTDYTETFSPVMKTDSFRTLLAYSTMAGYEFHHFDVETAFLYGKLSETIYMTQPPGYQDDKKKKTSVCILNQALYGLKQSGRVCYERRNIVQDSLVDMAPARKICTPDEAFTEVYEKLMHKIYRVDINENPIDDNWRYFAYYQI
ncbi:hypothetical protein LAZ67_20000875 [Cordylochernes scorpioides]|uniref:Integrase catalytic domain-containing protein n=1 Tax=Cordylochernes scorpioides TaxID=51811 RepID=A0ABY6LL67_9ARAC|nr:hypothetical protein LAZ67_20000875 [Cordylochernes scorpioides]